MLKKYIFTTAIVLLASVSVASAADIKAEKGKKIELTELKSGRDFTFQPSPQVNMAGTTSATSFVIAAVHNAALKKTGGMSYAMSSETSGMYSRDVNDEGALPEVSLPAEGSDQAAFETAMKTAKYKVDGAAPTT